ncbi:hypothetical protein A6U97_11585 [Agrobacterium tumefaciens]|jgi:hypothetical protein|uniref:Uncharacterized protein n=1 Tax=Agrobacterium tumefaciens TaxID=358 RepID=A0AB36EMD1_AGRTU|nr:hypothetical protein DXM29_07470 [Agrobacterium tumefaciens]KQY42135.1 hypothetical protein ASD46_12915 [Rhizobium sp. Root491]HCV72861.1 hypothetical protein [Agrobacterium sp.]OCJ42387.1 hypothetical protein A6U91_00565 [Agrobacterium tumefaciens]OCJ64946.1 hypothetical protein A6U97_11585 [Agrobacterium tumefaciens]
MLPACRGLGKNEKQIRPFWQNYGSFVCFALAKSVNILRSNRMTRFLKRREDDRDGGTEIVLDQIIAGGLMRFTAKTAQRMV